VSMEWWRCKHGAPYDPKWRAVAARAGSGIRPGDVWAVFTALCDRASQAQDRGSLEGLDAEDIAAGFGYDLEQVKAILGALKAKGLIDDARVTTWEKHQPKREDDGATQRKREQRERERTERELSGNSVTNDVSRDVTQSHSREEKSRLDTDSEKKGEGEERSQARAAPAISPHPPEPVVLKPRSQRWPADAVVPDDWLEDGRKLRHEHGLPEIDLRLEATQFANYWASKSGGSAAKLDWRKTWENWALKAYTNGQAGRSGKQAGHPLGVFGAVLEKTRTRGGPGPGEHQA
jgi:hypothetical protein